MHIGFLISGHLETLTGGYIYDRQLVEYLRQKGHQVEVIHFDGNNYFGRLRQAFRLALSRKIDYSSWDILLQDELDHPALILLNQRLKGEAVSPIISIIHNLHCCELRAKWQNDLFRRIEKRYLLSVDGFVFNSQTTRRVVENLLGKSRPGVVAYPCGNRLPASITEKEIKDRARTPGPLRILFLGNILRNKGLHILLAALKEVPENDCFLTVIGDLTMDRTYVRTLRNQIDEWKLNDRVSIIGPLDNAELGVRIKEAQVLAVPSFYEGFGIVYLEGMGLGLPAIGTTAGAANEIITPGKDGYLVPAGDSAILAECLRKLNEDRELLTSMSLNARARFNSHPAWQATGEIILNFMQSVVSDTR